jgi:hypothetical protein
MICCGNGEGCGIWGIWQYAFLSDNLLKLPCWQNEEAAVAYAAAFRKIEKCLCS